MIIKNHIGNDIILCISAAELTFSENILCRSMNRKRKISNNNKIRQYLNTSLQSMTSAQTYNCMSFQKMLLQLLCEISSSTAIHADWSVITIAISIYPLYTKS